MKRFIDLTKQYYCDPENTCLTFAWLDTIVDQFESHSGSQVWDCWSDFEGDYEGNQIERYRALFPKEHPLA